MNSVSISWSPISMFPCSACPKMLYPLLATHVSMGINQLRMNSLIDLSVIRAFNFTDSQMSFHNFLHIYLPLF